MAASFVNGGFEDGTVTGWQLGGGHTQIPTNALDATKYLPGGSSYNAALEAITVTSLGGVDAITGAPTVYSGNHAVRVNDAVNNYSVSVITQTVTNYDAAQIGFAWNAVLQSSHGLTDSDAFNLILRDDTTNTELVNRSYSSASAPGVFTPFAYGSWYSSGWRTETLDVTGLKGHTFTLSLLATDCPYGAHAGYVYLDGFGKSAPTPGPIPAVPEPESYAMLIGGLAVVGGLLRRRRQA
ncbi:MAG: PEP-CTERM sorting domain-containing protein [Burkholderiales bacterium]|nr:PEP-CTERM sorting domain-containing protein [Burkholderiales bacterium]MDE2078299.1 PEP-CTERM sorting domain-containing protein [Burkholderiales bacterium]MDE2433803.1 PEP-CTERM sorting domain-containing protein [Burkholderiales bacterium]